uniref:Uncharacterized protein n=1 Tax=Scophthalmus maximus TaxID=52904 RepID=A0A8D3AM76_SCOMX
INSYLKAHTCWPIISCLWCFANNTCSEYPVRWFLPPASMCPLSQARWGLCWLNFEALIIALAVLGGSILISIAVCCCCCCCKKRPLDRDDERFTRKREEIKQRSEERMCDEREFNFNPFQEEQSFPSVKRKGTNTFGKCLKPKGYQR